MSDLWVYKWSDPNLKILLIARNVKNVDKLFAESDHTMTTIFYEKPYPTSKHLNMVGKIEP